METKLFIERPASSVYTNQMFNEVQFKIVSAVMKYVIPNVHVDRAVKIFDIDDGSGSNFKVSYDSLDDLVTCSCKAFTRRGIPCNHMICVMCTLRFDRIPQKYILSRWSKFSHCSLLYGDQYITSVSRESGVNTHQFFAELGKSIACLKNSIKLQEELLDDLKVISEKFSKVGINQDAASSKSAMIESFYKCKYPETIHVKDSGSGGRIKSYKEKAIKAKQKLSRTCKTCNRLVNHDSRNCPEKNKQDTI